VITVSECCARTTLRGLALGVAGATIAGWIGGCSSQAARQQTELAVLSSALPGVYHDGGAPVAAAAGAAAAGAPGASSAPTLTFSIKRVRVQLVGDVVFFVRETAATNAHLVFEQRIWTLVLNAQGQVLQRTYRFKDPRRWVGVADDQDLLLSLLPEDLELLQGCELIWQLSSSDATGAPRAAHGPPRATGATDATHFEASPAHDSCQPGEATQGQSIERGATLNGTELSLAERQIGADGSLLPTSGPAFTLILRRGSGASSGAGATSATNH
jgi:hypothetical protein